MLKNWGQYRTTIGWRGREYRTSLRCGCGCGEGSSLGWVNRHGVEDGRRRHRCTTGCRHVHVGHRLGWNSTDRVDGGWWYRQAAEHGVLVHRMRGVSRSRVRDRHHRGRDAGDWSRRTRERHAHHRHSGRQAVLKGGAGHRHRRKRPGRRARQAARRRHLHLHLRRRCRPRLRLHFVGTREEGQPTTGRDGVRAVRAW